MDPGAYRQRHIWDAERGMQMANTFGQELEQLHQLADLRVLPELRESLGQGRSSARRDNRPDQHARFATLAVAQ